MSTSPPSVTRLVNWLKYAVSASDPRAVVTAESIPSFLSSISVAYQAALKEALPCLGSGDQGPDLLGSASPSSSGGVAQHVSAAGESDDPLSMLSTRDSLDGKDSAAMDAAGAADDKWSRFYKCTSLLREIDTDLPRLYINGIDETFFQPPSPDDDATSSSSTPKNPNSHKPPAPSARELYPSHYSFPPSPPLSRLASLTNVLYLYSISTPLISYRQGMHELAGCIFHEVSLGVEAIWHTTVNGGVGKLLAQAQKRTRDATLDLWIEGATHLIFQYIMDCGLKDLYDPRDFDERQLTEEVNRLNKWRKVGGDFRAVRVDGGDGDGGAHNAVQGAGLYKKAAGAKKSDGGVAKIPQAHKTTLGVFTSKSLVFSPLSYLHPPLNNLLTVDFAIPPQLFLLKWLRLMFSREFPRGSESGEGGEGYLVFWDFILKCSYENRISPPPSPPPDSAEPSPFLLASTKSATPLLTVLASVSLSLILSVESELLSSGNDDNDILVLLMRYSFPERLQPPSSSGDGDEESSLMGRRSLPGAGVLVIKGAVRILHILADRESGQSQPGQGQNIWRQIMADVNPQKQRSGREGMTTGSMQGSASSSGNRAISPMGGGGGGFAATTSGLVGSIKNNLSQSSKTILGEKNIAKFGTVVGGVGSVAKSAIASGPQWMMKGAAGAAGAAESFVSGPRRKSENQPKVNPTGGASNNGAAPEQAGGLFAEYDIHGDGSDEEEAGEEESFFGTPNTATKSNFVGDPFDPFGMGSSVISTQPVPAAKSPTLLSFDDDAPAHVAPPPTTQSEAPAPPPSSVPFFERTIESGDLLGLGTASSSDDDSASDSSDDGGLFSKKKVGGSSKASKMDLLFDGLGEGKGKSSSDIFGDSGDESPFKVEKIKKPKKEKKDKKETNAAPVPLLPPKAPSTAPPPSFAAAFPPAPAQVFAKPKPSGVDLLFASPDKDGGEDDLLLFRKGAPPPAKAVPAPMEPAKAAINFFDDGDDLPLFGGTAKAAAPAKKTSLFLEEGEDVFASTSSGAAAVTKEEPFVIAKAPEAAPATKPAVENEFLRKRGKDAIDVLKKYLQDEGAGAPKKIWDAIRDLENIMK